MAEQDAGLEQDLDPEVERRARSMGWKPEAEWKGDPPSGGFVSAEEYIERGESVIPIVRAENKRLKEQLERMQAEGRSQSEQLKMLNASLATLRETLEEDEAGNQLARRKELMDELKEAIKEDDADRQAEILEQLTAAPEKKPAKAATRQEPPAIPPELKAGIDSFFSEAKDWYGVDEDRTILFEGICANLRRKGSTKMGKEFLDEALEILEEKEGSTRKPPASKVGGARQRTDDGTGGERGTGGYSRLPAEARAQCDRDAQSIKFPNRRYKDVAAFRAAWAQQYTSQG